MVQGGFTGTGLGLPIVKLLVDLLGGQLSVTSQLNQGSQFKIKFYLPSKEVVHPISNVYPTKSQAIKANENEFWLSIMKRWTEA